MIFIDRPFKIGDTIRSPDREIEGTVEYIGLRLTQIRTLTKTKLFVPNSLFSSISLENLSRMTHRRIKTMLYLHPEDAPKLKSLVEEMEELLKRDSRIDFAERGYVRLIASNPIFLKVELHALTKVTHLVEFHLVQQDILLKWLDLFKRHGCRFVSEEQVASYSSSL
jgi:MscS family membrane protein